MLALSHPPLLPSAATTARHPGLHCFRRSQPGLYTPLSTLRVTPRGATCMTRGRCGSLPLHRSGLSPPTSCRSPGAPRLNGWPARSPADASPTSSRMPAHGLGPMWVATPSSQWTCTTCSLPVSRRTRVKSPCTPISDLFPVIPAQAGIQIFQALALGPRFRGDDDFASTPEFSHTLD